MLITGDDEPVGIDDPERAPSEGGEEEEDERRFFGDPPITGNLLARAIARQPGVSASMTLLAGKAVEEDEPTIVEELRNHPAGR